MRRKERKKTRKTYLMKTTEIGEQNEEEKAPSKRKEKRRQTKSESH